MGTIGHVIIVACDRCLCSYIGFLSTFLTLIVEVAARVDVSQHCNMGSATSCKPEAMVKTSCAVNESSFII